MNVLQRRRSRLGTFLQSNLPNGRRVRIAVVAILISVTVVVSGLMYFPSTSNSEKSGTVDSGLSASLPPVAPGTHATFTCLHGTIALSGTIECNDNSNTYDVCYPAIQCPYSLVGTFDVGHPFKEWLITGAVSLGSTTLISTTATFTGSTGADYAEIIECNSNVPAITVTGTPIQEGWRQAWVNWTDSNEYSTEFNWGTSASNLNLVVPELSGLSVNLNDINASTTYYYKIVDTNSCGQTTTATGDFTTGTPAAGKISGWVSSQSATSDPYQLTPIGSPLSGTAISLGAWCPHSSGSGDFWLSGFAIENISPYNLIETNIHGYYTIQFPVFYSTAADSWYLDAAGNCIYTDPVTTVATPAYILDVGLNGYFQSQRVISSDLANGRNAYQPITEIENQAAAVPVGLAIIDNSPNVANAECGFTFWTSSYGSLAYQDISLGTYAATNESASSGSSWNSPGSWRNDTGLNLLYPSSGLINYTNGATFASTSAWVAASSDGSSAIPITTTEWLTDINTETYFPTSVLPAGWQVAIPGVHNTELSPLSQSVFAQGSYSSTAGTQLMFTVGVDFAGVSVGTSFSTSATTTVTTTLGSTASCSFAYVTDPSGNGGNPYYFYFNGAYLDNAVPTPDVHVWLAGWCGGSGGEPSC
jgi:hypothetical protein